MSRLDDLEALEKAATRGPWEADPEHCVVAVEIADITATAYTESDAALIAEVRNLLSALVAVTRSAQAVGYELHHNSMHFHERAVVDPFEAEAFVQEEGAKLLHALAPLLDEGDAG